MTVLNRLSSLLSALGLIIALNSIIAAQHHDHHDQRALDEDPHLAQNQLAPLLEGLGDHHHAITTNSAQAQQFFDQGIKLTYGFNHQEALRSFKEAGRLDPDCAMAYWGWALVLGPNLNLPMSAEAAPQAFRAIQMALARKAKVSAKEQAYIDALAQRYSDDPEADQSTLDAAYAAAMGQLSQDYPDDPDAATLYAAALMNLSPWNYWTQDGQARPRTPEILAVLEKVNAGPTPHIGALHYYIHAVEPVDPDRGLAAADLLHGLTPGAGHLVHMPSHIYMQVGRYADSYAANAAASKADEDYITQCAAQGIYPLNYYPHNLHFLTWSAIMEGRSSAALAAARKMAAKVPQDHSGNVWGLYQTFLSAPLYVLVRFGQWQAILDEPSPPAEMKLWKGVWHYARGMAYTHTGNKKKGDKELKALKKISEDPKASEDLIGFSNAGRLLTIATEVLSGEIAAQKEKYRDALTHLERAVRLEDSLYYNEPPDWYYPVRHTLGAVLIEAGYPDEAETVYWQDLRRNRSNGYALFGLWQSLKAQDRSEEAVAVEAQFNAAWQGADVQLSSSRF